jgi:hypothetical protein
MTHHNQTMELTTWFLKLNAKADAIHNMRDDSTPIGSHQEGSGDAERAPSEGDDTQRTSPGDGARADGGSKLMPYQMLWGR